LKTIKLSLERQNSKKVNDMRAKLLSIEIDLEDMECSINVLNASIEHTELTIECLYDNLEVLKATSVIASLKQFKNTIDQLSMARKKLALMKNKRKTLNDKLIKKEENRKHYEKELNNALDEREILRQSDVVVNIAEFRRKNER